MLSSKSGKSLPKSGKSLPKSGKSLFKSGESLFKSGKSLSKPSKSFSKSGKSFFKSGKSLFKSGKSLSKSPRTDTEIKSRHRKLTLENTVLPPLLPGLEPTTGALTTELSIPTSHNIDTSTTHKF